MKVNNLADKEAKKAALEAEEKVVMIIDSVNKQEEEEVPKFTEQEEKELNSGVRDEEGRWKMADGRQDKALARRGLRELHSSTHWGTQALYDSFLRSYACVGAFEIAETVTRDYMICLKINKKVMRTAPLGARQLAKRPFQKILIDFTELPQIKRLKYLLVIIGHLTHWIKAFPMVNTTAQRVSKILSEQIIPRYGILNVIDSD